MQAKDNINQCGKIKSMKHVKVFYVFILICMVTMSFTSEKQINATIELPKEWKFQIGDNSEYSKPEFDDKAWKTIDVENFWESQGYTDYDGIAWYRTKIVIPASFKERNAMLKYMILQLGRIDDGDDTYFNGVRLGGKIAWDAYRSYLIPIDLIKWDQENVLAIRVNDIVGNGGMYGGPNRIVDAHLANVMSLKSIDKPSEFTSKGGSEFTKKVFFEFKVPVERIEGTLVVKIYDPVKNKIVYRHEENIIIGNNADSSYSFKVQIKEPDSYKLEYSFYSKSVADTMQYSTLFSYVPTPRGKGQKEYPLVKLNVPDKAFPFGLEDIHLEGYLNERLNANLEQRLLNIDETGILECYYNRPGAQTWVGEYVGKYLHAASRVWQSTKNEQLKSQMDRIVDILISCQKEDGYLGTYLPVDYWTEWDVWAHKYNLLGLLSYYSVTGYKPALESSIKMGDLLCRTFGEKDGQLNIINSSSHIGMASTSVLEPMTYLYRYTGDKKYLDFCNYIIKAYEYDKGPKIISTLTSIGKVDRTADAKAYEMLSNLTGIVKLYQLTGNEKLLKTVENAWTDVYTNKLYITGTASKGEVFQEDLVLPAENDDHIGEGCVTTTWLQFNQALYNLTAETKYIDEIEKTIYNHLFAAENPLTGCVSYYTALQGKKLYRCNINAHCCLASIPRGIAAVPELVYTKSETNGCFINIYSSGNFNDSLKTSDGHLIPVKLSVSSGFPESGTAAINVSTPDPASFTIALRVPVWSKGYIAKVDGKAYKGTPGQYLKITRSWKKNTKIMISMDLNVQELDGGASYPGFVAIKTGPQVLAFDQALNPGITDIEKIEIENTHIELSPKTGLPSTWFGTELFKLNAFYDNKPVVLKLVPFAEAGQTGGEVRVWMKKKK